MFIEPVIVGCERIGAHCKVHPMTARKMLVEGRLSGELIGNRWMVRQADLDAWLATNPAELTRRHKPRQPRATA